MQLKDLKLQGLATGAVVVVGMNVMPLEPEQFPRSWQIGVTGRITMLGLSVAEDWAATGIADASGAPTRTHRPSATQAKAKKRRIGKQ